jgi:hypothetical protein
VYIVAGDATPTVKPRARRRRSSFDTLRMSGWPYPLMVSLSNHDTLRMSGWPSPLMVSLSNHDTLRTSETIALDDEIEKLR